MAGRGCKAGTGVRLTSPNKGAPAAAERSNDSGVACVAPPRCCSGAAQLACLRVLVLGVADLDERGALQARAAHLRRGKAREERAMRWRCPAASGACRVAWQQPRQEDVSTNNTKLKLNRTGKETNTNRRPTRKPSTSSRLARVSQLPSLTGAGVGGWGRDTKCELCAGSAACTPANAPPTQSLPGSNSQGVGHVQHWRTPRPTLGSLQQRASAAPQQPLPTAPDGASPALTGATVKDAQRLGNRWADVVRDPLAHVCVHLLLRHTGGGG